jgi:hypothetical protein
VRETRLAIGRLRIAGYRAVPVNIQMTGRMTTPGEWSFERHRSRWSEARAGSAVVKCARFGERWGRRHNPSRRQEAG